MTDLAKLAWPKVQEFLRQGCAAILPVGATEAHGPHLPLDTDVTIAQGMARRAAARWQAPGRHAVVMPPVAYSVADFAGGFAGTISLPPETARAHLAAILIRATEAGFAPVAVANAHLEPAHIQTIVGACDDAETATGTRPVFPDVTRRKLAARLGEEFVSGACHAGRYEGSLVMADDPGAVDEEVRLALPPNDNSLVDAIRDGLHDFAAAGGPQAYFGHPAEATAAEGETLYAELAAILVEAMEAAGA